MRKATLVVVDWLLIIRHTANSDPKRMVSFAIHRDKVKSGVWPPDASCYRPAIHQI
jgi:hypothetical protein